MKDRLDQKDLVMHNVKLSRPPTSTVQKHGCLKFSFAPKPHGRWTVQLCEGLVLSALPKPDACTVESWID